ncbi:MAG TPA: hypothetical protein VIL99_17075 [Ignavibacteria bacterium]
MKASKTITYRIKSMSKTLSIIFKIARIACYIGIGISIVCIIYLIIFGNTELKLLILSGKVTMSSPFTNSNIFNLDIKQLITIVIAGIISMILMANLFRQVENIFKDIHVDSSPFEMKQVKRIKRVAILYLIISLINFETSATSIMISLNLVGIVGALMFWCIALIFEYGCALQKESDETL